jgi:hypothetical protein
MALPESSMILLLPVGDEYSTVSEATKIDWVTNNFSVAADKELICKWLFNAKTLDINVVVSSSGVVVSNDTYTHQAGNDLEGITATDHPLPFNDLFEGQILNDFISNQSNLNRWITPSLSPGNYFYVFVYEGVWYWSPGVLFSGQTVSTLGSTSFTVSWTDVVITFTITATFY